MNERTSAVQLIRHAQTDMERAQALALIAYERIFSSFPPGMLPPWDTLQEDARWALIDAIYRILAVCPSVR